VSLIGKTAFRTDRRYDTIDGGHVGTSDLQHIFQGSNQQAHLLRSHVLRCSPILRASRSSSVPVERRNVITRDVRPCDETKIANLDFAVEREQNVRWFQVPVNIALLMDINYRTDDLQKARNLVAFASCGNSRFLKQTVAHKAGQTSHYLKGKNRDTARRTLINPFDRVHSYFESKQLWQWKICHKLVG